MAVFIYGAAHEGQLSLHEQNSKVFIQAMDAAILVTLISWQTDINAEKLNKVMNKMLYGNEAKRVKMSWWKNYRISRK